MDIKKQFIENLLDNSIENAKSELQKVGLGADIFDSIDKAVLVNDMITNCTLSGEKLLEVEAFLNSELFKEYQDSVSAMADVVFKWAMNDIQESGGSLTDGKTIH